MHQQGGALVGGKTACKADGQGVGVEHFIGGGDFRLRRAAALKLQAQAAPGKRHQPFPLVTCPMGISSCGTPGQMDFHIPRLTSPWSLLTPLLADAIRSASTVMQNSSSARSGCWRPNP